MAKKGKKEKKQEKEEKVEEVVEEELIEEEAPVEEPVLEVQEEEEPPRAIFKQHDKPNKYYIESKTIKFYLWITQKQMLKKLNIHYIS